MQIILYLRITLYAIIEVSLSCVKFLLTFQWQHKKEIVDFVLSPGLRLTLELKFNRNIIIQFTIAKNLHFSICTARN